jgi:hypothetical protein
MQIESLTKEQEDAIPSYVEKWKKIGTKTGKIRVEDCVPFVEEIYKTAENLPPPEYYLGPFNNPIEAAYAESIVDNYCDGKYKTNEKANKAILAEVNRYFMDPTHTIENLSISNQVYGNMDATWLSFYNYFLEQCNLEDCNILKPYMQLAEVSGWWTPLERAALFQHFPKALHFDDRERIHNLNGPAIEYYGSTYCNVYAVHGVVVTKDIIEKNFTAKDIDNQSNAEVRRVMIDIYGEEKYIQGTNATVVHSDDFGTLYRKELEGDEPILMVKVVNSTKEPDGSYKDYWVRVAPEVPGYGPIKTARAAVASTWRNPDGSLVFAKPEDYDPCVET